MTVPSTGRTSRGTAAVDLLATLYPPPLSVLVGEGPGSRRVWSALPTAGNPRLLVPAGRGGGATTARAVRRQLTGRRLRTRVARTGLSLATGLGTLDRWSRTRIAVVGRDDAPSIEDPLRDLLGVRDLRLTMPIGPARSNRKPVVQVTDVSGEVLAFAKVGHTDLTRRLVRREAEVLERLAAGPLEGVRPPRRLALVEWRDCEVLVLEPLEIPGRRLRGREGRRRLLTLVEEISRLGGTGEQPWSEHPLRHRLMEMTEDCGDLADRLRAALNAIQPALPMATRAWHGDLNPGNVALLRGPCPVWDWERFDTGVPAGFDLLHHDLHEAITMNGIPPSRAAQVLVEQAPATLAGLGVQPQAADAAARCYLVSLACRYLADDQRAAGGDLGRVEEWLLPAIEGVRQ